MREVPFPTFLSGEGAGKSVALFRGFGEFSVSNGRGRKELRDWRINPEDQDKIIEWRRTDEGGGVRINKTPHSPGRPRAPRKPRNRCKRTKEMF